MSDTQAQKAYDFIIDAVSTGKTVYIKTAYSCKVITIKSASRLRLGEGDNLLYSRGNGYDVIDLNEVNFSAE